MARVVRFHQTGGPEVLKVEDVEVRSPASGEVRIRVQAIGLNRAECLFRAGQYLAIPAFPSTLGYEAAGVVEALGSGVTGFKVGDRVSVIPAFDLTQYGTYGELINIPAHAVAHYPEAFSPTQGAAVWMQYVTAWCGLVQLGKLEKGQNVLITAASSSVGLAAIQVARSLGATPIAATRTAAKKVRLLAAGAQEVIVTSSEDLPARVMAVTGNVGAHVIFDPVSGPYVETLAQASAQQGKLLIYGFLDPRPTPYPLYAAFTKALWMRAFALFEYTLNPAALAQAKAFISAGMTSGDLLPVVDDSRFNLTQIADAHRHMESNTQFGKIVVSV